MGTSYYGAIDLHSNNGYTAIIDDEDRVVYSKRLPNRVEAFLEALAGFKDRLHAVAIESTFNWYWLVDALMNAGYTVELVHTTGVKQYSGIKNAGDKNDAIFLARLLRLGILPTGHIYDKGTRPVRDMLRRRMLLVQQRTAQILSFHSLIYRQTGSKLSRNAVMNMSKDMDSFKGFFCDSNLEIMGLTALSVIQSLAKHITLLEKTVEKQVRLDPKYKEILNVPGIGKILGTTIMLETGDISRFDSAGKYASYCRCVKAKRTSNEKSKGNNNSKNGNRYLAWAYMEAANFAIRFHKTPGVWYQRKLAKSLPVVARKAMAAKLSKACYYIIRDQTSFDMRRLFG